MLRAQDLVDGSQGTVYMTRDGKRTALINVKNVRAAAALNKSEKRVLGRRQAINRINGYSGTGSMTLYYMNSAFRRMLLEFKKTGRYPYFDLQVTNDDEGSSVGRQTVVLLNCLPDEITLSALDIEAEDLEEEIAFTFEDFDAPELFADIPEMG
ncbi:MAG: phage tail tube protein [Bacillota bacterium]|nr:phage tail tube protein [Bacillota bacterium]